MNYRLNRLTLNKIGRAFALPSFSVLSTPAGARTLDTLIKSQVLYQLSYGCIIFCSSSRALSELRVQRYGVFLNPPNILRTFFEKKMKKGSISDEMSLFLEYQVSGFRIQMNRTVSPAITMLTIDMSLMRMLSEGPDVSLKGSPTVSPTMVAL